jgi:UDP:flavonoid glycosyltransferase YjiC (YdhE family)
MTSRRPARIACIVSPNHPTHLGGILSVAAELVKAGAEVRVWTGQAFAPRIASIGAHFADLLEGRCPSQLRDESRPVPVRQVAFAAHYADSLASDLRAWAADLIISEGFTLIGRIAAEVLNKPWVLINAGHNVNCAAYRAVAGREVPNAISETCWAAVEILRCRYGLKDASPYYYAGDQSPWANVFLEPREWATEAGRLDLANAFFFGASQGDGARDERPGRRDSGAKTVYASLGVTVWRYLRNEALAILRGIAEAAPLVKGASLSIGLGGACLAEDELAELRKYGATVYEYADQPARLSESGAFITHHGMGATHDAVAARVPMLSYPLFADQPALAALSQAFGLAKPLKCMSEPPAPAPAPERVAQSLEELFANSRPAGERLDAAWEWEAAAMAARPALARRLIELGAG